MKNENEIVNIKVKCQAMDAYGWFINSLRPSDAYMRQ